MKLHDKMVCPDINLLTKYDGQLIFLGSIFQQLHSFIEGTLIEGEPLEYPSEVRVVEWL